MLHLYEDIEQARQVLLARRQEVARQAARDVARILQEVRQEGDEALIRLLETYDEVKTTPEHLRVSEAEIAAAEQQVEPEFKEAVALACRNITEYHRQQLSNSWFCTGPQGEFLGQLVTPLARVGIYVPGGKASYPSSVLMNALPARVAGVAEIVMVTPPRPDGSLSPHVLYAARQAGVTEIYRVGGAQAIAALAYGTPTIRRVDKITGPGNIYVTLAKQQVYGVVDIDMLAGPSEVLVVADDSAPAAYVAADLLAQAEHDQLASAVLVTTSRRLAAAVQQELARQLPLLARREIVEQALANQGAIVLVDSLDTALALANELAPEHLELMVEQPLAWLGRVRCAGAVFLGPYSPEPLGDYLAGPNHVLPTGGTARFYSPLGVESFLKRTSVIGYTPEALRQVAGAAITLAAVEGLDAHAASIKIRL
ncbi:MAG: histidinol dehydrogenase [Desulfurispora sp.]|uniref:histidinol dehydrogenase n=1 Tax=Desulfurispora sp. TaxID=3014275 RepID=UPI00404B93E5